MDEDDSFASYIGKVFLTPEKVDLFLRSLKLIYNRLCPSVGPSVPEANILRSLNHLLNPKLYSP